MLPLETLPTGDPSGGVVYLRIVLSPEQVSRLWLFLNISVLQERVVSTSPNPQAGGPPLVGCPWLLIQFICSYPPYRGPFLYPQPEDAPCHGDRDPLQEEVLVWNSVGTITILHASFWSLWRVPFKTCTENNPRITFTLSLVPDYPPTIYWPHSSKRSMNPSRLRALSHSLHSGSILTARRRAEAIPVPHRQLMPPALHCSVRR